MTATVNSSNVSRPALLAEDVYGDDLFGPGPAPRRRGRRIVTLLTVVVLVAALAGVTLSSARASGARYRVATVTNADATAVLDGVATIEPVSQATVAFPMSGTVTHVAVKTGQTVHAGQTLAALDTTSLYETIHTDEASLAQAKLTLADALDGTSSGSTTSGSGASGSSTSGSSTSGSSSGTATLTAATTSNSSTSKTASSKYAVTSGATPTTSKTSAPTKSGIAAAQQAVVAAQAQVDRGLADADAAIKAAETVCGTATTRAAIGPSSTTAPTTTASTTSTTTSSTNPVGSCTTALQTSLAAQQSVSVAQRSLDAAVQHLTALLDAEASAPTSNTNGTTGSQNGQSTGTGAQTGVASGAQSGVTSGGGSSTTKTATAADLEADQARVDAATAKLDVAVQALAQPRITTPIAGTIIAVNIAAGDSVSANSSTETVIVEGAKGYEVTTSVPVAEMTRVSVGQQASVLPDGAASTINGRVTEISAVPATSTTGTTTYNVVISLDHAPSTLQDGTTGSVSIITDAAKAAVVVPSSAVHTSGKNHTVTVALGGSSTKTVSVTVGVQGATTTQIKRGLAAGQHVVIADLNKALPSSATSTQSSSRTNRTGVSGLGGTGGPPSGFTPSSR